MVYPANVITTSKTKILSKKVEIKEEIEETTGVEPSSSSKIQTPTETVDLYAKAPKETVIVSYSEQYL